jgi:hypothetical protein
MVDNEKLWVTPLALEKGERSALANLANALL